MLLVALRRNDGISSGRPWLRSVVRTLQLGLTEAGHPEQPDGRFGPKTEKAVEALQLSQGLLDTGVMGKATWKVLREPIARALGPHRQRTALNLPAFDGDLRWIHLLEGHRGRPYWPGGGSGVTLDPGIDLGAAEPAFLTALLDELYGQAMNAEQRRAVDAVFGIRGDAAKQALAADPVLNSIRISSELADEIFPVATRPYWAEIGDRFVTLRYRETPPSVQTVLLSLAYNRGAGNRYLEPLGEMLAARDWAAVADKVSSMQQDHRLQGIRRRRREEGALIRAELECLQA